MRQDNHRNDTYIFLPGCFTVQTVVGAWSVYAATVPFVFDAVPITDLVCGDVLHIRYVKLLLLMLYETTFKHMAFLCPLKAR